MKVFLLFSFVFLLKSFIVVKSVLCAKSWLIKTRKSFCTTRPKSGLTHHSMTCLRPVCRHQNKLSLHSGPAELQHLRESLISLFYVSHAQINIIRDTKFNAGQNNITHAYQRVALMLFALLSGDDLQISRLFALLVFYDDNMALKFTMLAFRNGRDVPHHVWLMAAVVDDVRRGNMPRSFVNWQVEIDKRSPRMNERMDVLKFCENCGRMHSIRKCLSLLK